MRLSDGLCVLTFLSSNLSILSQNKKTPLKPLSKEPERRYIFLYNGCLQSVIFSQLTFIKYSVTFLLSVFTLKYIILCGKNQGNNLIFVTDLDFFVRFNIKMYDWYISAHKSDKARLIKGILFFSAYLKALYAPPTFLSTKQTAKSERSIIYLFLI